MAGAAGGGEHLSAAGDRFGVRRSDGGSERGTGLPDPWALVQPSGRVACGGPIHLWTRTVSGPGLHDRRVALRGWLREVRVHVPAEHDPEHLRLRARDFLSPGLRQPAKAASRIISSSPGSLHPPSMGSSHFTLPPLTEKGCTR